ncbi:MAG: redoxin family protein, partial [Planctomycetota bacterium]
LDGSTVEPFSISTTKAIVLVFIGTDCPIANAYHPKLQELENEFSDKGVEFFLIHSNSDLTFKEAEEHAAEYALKLPVVLDDNQRIARRAGAKVTPETFVFVPHQSDPVYRGAIDNLYADYGKKRQSASKNYLHDCLGQLLAGNKIATPETKPLGCFLYLEPLPET